MTSMTIFIIRIFGTLFCLLLKLKVKNLNHAHALSVILSIKIRQNNDEHAKEFSEAHK